jgi:hypothetical protein
MFYLIIKWQLARYKQYNKNSKYFREKQFSSEKKTSLLIKISMFGVKLIISKNQLPKLINTNLEFTLIDN